MLAQKSRTLIATEIKGRKIVAPTHAEQLNATGLTQGQRISDLFLVGPYKKSTDFRRENLPNKVRPWTQMYI